MSPTNPQPFGKYLLLRRLAFGGMAEIFLAALNGDKGFSKKVVVKRILPQFGSDPGFVSMFIDEAVLAARLTHENIVQVYDFGDVEGVHFIAMEYVDGVDLRRLLRAAAEKSRPLTFPEVAALGEGICRGLSYAHAACDDDGVSIGLVHRDVSPHNVMLSRSGEAKVMDFGVAKGTSRLAQTATGMVKGKLAYMAPEHASGHDVDKRADQFSVGLVLWECLTGRRLFTAKSDLELLQKVTACNIPPLDECRSDVPDALMNIVMRMLSANKDDRYNDLAEVEVALSEYRFSLGAQGAVRLADVVNVLCPVHSSASPNLGARATRVRRTRAMAVPAQNGGTASIEADTPAPSTSPPAVSSALAAAPSGWLDDEPDEAADAATWSLARWLGRATRLLGSGHAHTLLEAPVEGSVGTEPAPVPVRHTKATVAVAVSVVAAVGIAIVSARSDGSDAAASAPNRLATLVVTSQPSGAEVTIDGIPVGLRTPTELPRRTVGEVLAVGAVLEGYNSVQRQLVVSSARESVDLVLNESHQIASPAPSASAVVKDPPAIEVQEGPKSAQRRSARRRPRQGKPKPALAGTGKLSLRSRGTWYTVYLGDKRLGTTPLKGVELPAGKHMLRFVNPGLDVNEEVAFAVTDGDDLHRTVSFER